MSKRTRRRLDAALKGEGSAGGVTERSDRRRTGGEISASPAPDLRLQEAAARRCGRGFFRREIVDARHVGEGDNAAVVAADAELALSLERRGCHRLGYDGRPAPRRAA